MTEQVGVKLAKKDFYKSDNWFGRSHLWDGPIQEVGSHLQRAELAQGATRPPGRWNHAGEAVPVNG